MAHAAAHIKKARSEMDQPPDLKALEKARERRRRSRERAERKRKVSGRLTGITHSFFTSSITLPHHHHHRHDHHHCHLSLLKTLTHCCQGLQKSLSFVHLHFITCIIKDKEKSCLDGELLKTKDSVVCSVISVTHTTEMKHTPLNVSSLLSPLVFLSPSPWSGMLVSASFIPRLRLPSCTCHINHQCTISQSVSVTVSSVTRSLYSDRNSLLV